MNSAKAFRSGREFAARLGLVSKQIGTGGEIQLLSNSWRGDAYVRMLLIHGARSVLFHGEHVVEAAKPNVQEVIQLGNLQDRFRQGGFKRAIPIWKRQRIQQCIDID